MEPVVLKSLENTGLVRVARKLTVRLAPRLALLMALLLPHAGAMAESLVIPGSGNPEHVQRVLAEAFNRAQSAHQVNVPPPTTCPNPSRWLRWRGSLSATCRS